MIKQFITVSFLFLIGTTAFAQAKDGKYIVDYKNSQLEWKGEKVTGSRHIGTLRVSSGVVTLTGNTITSGKIKVDVNSLTNSDVTDASYNAKLVNHLKGEDFFNTAKFPDAELVLVSGNPKKDASGNTHEVKGKLTIKGITQDVTFPAKLIHNVEQLLISGTFSFDRSKFDVRYGSPSFFSDLGDKAINNEVLMTFNLVTNR
ncbi:MAG: YceI family protein [Crocinitomicaceae bacterium]|nr:YceI family protein [Crocinitomicaceae bacterium]